ncbi:MAG: undecaprenyldiphospho-muramoylpentapeptide beta-N-acetylglucosaminyltransferase [Flavobacteriales bacterium]
MNTVKKQHFILSGGGTGGHINPAIAIAEELLKNPNHSVHFVGAKGKMEMEKVPAAGYQITGLPIRGYQRGQLKANLLLPFQVFFSLMKSFFLLKKQKPKAVIGTGGYASAPVAFMASLLGIPVFLQEQNSYPGLVNRLVSKRAKTIFTAYPEMEKFFPKTEVILSGNPLKNNILDSLSETAESQNIQVFIMGGSLGAKAINTFVIEHLEQIKQTPYQWLWQCGKSGFEASEKALSEHQDINNIKLQSFISNMGEAYAKSSVVLCRAGALSISELALVNKAIVFVPSPNVTDNHQYKNAKVLADAEACLLVEEPDLTSFFDDFLTFIDDLERQNRLKTNLKAFAKPEASQTIVEHIYSKL